MNDDVTKETTPPVTEAAQATAIPDVPEKAERVRSGRTRSEASREMWRKIHAGLLPKPGAKKAAFRAANPLLKLPGVEKEKLFALMRVCPHDDTVLQILRDMGLGDIAPTYLNDFYVSEAELRWETLSSRAAIEANALVRMAEKHPAKYSGAILEALGQEAFRLVSNGNVTPEAMSKLGNLFLRVRSDARVDQMQELRREKMQRELQGQVDHALELLAEEVDEHPAARETFEALRTELTKSEEEGV